MRALAVLVASLLLATVFGCAGPDRPSDFSKLAGDWVYEFACVVPEGNNPLVAPVWTEIRPNGEMFDLVANDVRADLGRGNWAGNEYQLTFRKNAYPVKVGGRKFKYDSLRLNLAPGGKLFTGRHVFGASPSTIDWCACDGVKWYKLPPGADPPTKFSPDTQMRPLACRRIALASGANMSTPDPPIVVYKQDPPAR